MNVEDFDRETVLSTLTSLKRDLTEKHLVQLGIVGEQLSPLGIGEGLNSFQISKEQVEAQLSVEEIQKKIAYLNEILEKLPVPSVISSWGEKLIPFGVILDKTNVQEFSITYKDGQLSFTFK